MTNLAPCPICSGTPTFGDVESKDERRYVELKLSCCVTMTDTIGWGTYRGLSDEEIRERLVNSLTASWNDRTPPEPADQENLIEKLAKEVERLLISDYEWTEEQFETWWNKDPRFIERECGRPGRFHGTQKGHLLWQIREGLQKAGLTLAETGES